MPYIITTRWEGAQHAKPSTPDAPNPVAVATLCEARKHTTNEARDRLPDTGFRRWMHTIDAARNLPNEGGTVGPLPDGTVIEVREVDEGALADISDAFPDGVIPDDPRERSAAILDAYNAQ